MSRRFALLLVAVATTAAAVPLACGGGGETAGTGAPGAGGAGSGSSSSGQSGGAGQGGDIFSNTDPVSLEITPKDPVIEVLNGAIPAPVVFTVTAKDMKGD